MDTKESIINNIVYTLQDKVSPETINIVQDALTIELAKYEVQKRCTEVTVLDTSAESCLKKFTATKRLEGLAETTIRRYFFHIFMPARVPMTGHRVKHGLFARTDSDFTVKLLYCRCNELDVSCSGG